MSAKDRLNELPKAKDVTREYVREARPGEGDVDTRQIKSDKEYKDEISIANWLHDVFGGNIEVLQYNNEGKHPDYRWNDKFWDLKTVTSQKRNTFDQHIRQAWKQIGENRGGIIIDITSNKMDREQAEAIIEDCISKRGLSGIDVIIKKSDAYKINRY